MTPPPCSARSPNKKPPTTHIAISCPKHEDNPQYDGHGDVTHGSHILFLDRIDIHEKGLDLLLAAIAAAEPALPVLLAGAGPRREERKLGRLLEQARGPVAWVGQVSGPARQELVQNCAFVVLPSRRETLGLSALEAMMWGKPVVHFDLPQLRWLGQDAAIGVPPFDVGALGTAIRGLAVNYAERAAMGRAARREAAGANFGRSAK